MIGYGGMVPYTIYHAVERRQNCLCLRLCNHYQPSNHPNETIIMNSPNDEDNMAIPSADVIRLILAHLTESGLHTTCLNLRNESGLGMAGIFPTSKGRLRECFFGRLIYFHSIMVMNISSDLTRSAN